MLRRTLIGLAMLAACALPVMAAEGPGDPVAWVAELYRTPALDAPDPSSDAAGNEQSGSELYGPSLRALLEIDARRDMNYLDFDWVSGGQDIPEYQDLKIVVVRRTADTARVRVTFKNYSDPRERLIDLVVEDGVWVIEDVYLKAPEKAWLSRILTENRQD